MHRLLLLKTQVAIISVSSWTTLPNLPKPHIQLVLLLQNTMISQLAQLHSRLLISQILLSTNSSQHILDIRYVLITSWWLLIQAHQKIIFLHTILLKLLLQAQRLIRCSDSWIQMKTTLAIMEDVEISLAQEERTCWFKIWMDHYLEL